MSCLSLRLLSLRGQRTVRSSSCTQSHCMLRSELHCDVSPIAVIEPLGQRIVRSSSCTLSHCILRSVLACGVIPLCDYILYEAVLVSYVSGWWTPWCITVHRLGGHPGLPWCIWGCDRDSAPAGRPQVTCNMQKFQHAIIEPSWTKDCTILVVHPKPLHAQK